MSHTGQTSKTSLFDIRNIIGALLFLYGVVLVIAGLAGTSSADTAKAGGINGNLWVGIVLVVVGAFFIIWARLRPVVVDEKQLEADKRAVEESAGRPTDPSA